MKLIYLFKELFLIIFIDIITISLIKFKDTFKHKCDFKLVQTIGPYYSSWHYTEYYRCKCGQGKIYHNGNHYFENHPYGKNK